MPGVVIFDRGRYDTRAKLAAAPSPRSMRNRHLEQAILTEAQLSHVDFTGARLEGANLVRARAQGAWFDRATLTGAQLDDAEMEGASFFNARMIGATASGAYLQGAKLAGANLRAAFLERAELDGATLAGADLRWATLDGAHLAGTNLAGAMLQLASLAEVTLDGASLDRAALLKADFRGATALSGLRANNPDLAREDAPCNAPPQGACDPTDTNDRIHALITRYVPDNPSRARMLNQLLNERTVQEWQAPDQHARIKPLQAADKNLVALWTRIACTGKAAPFVIMTLVDTYDDADWTRPRSKAGTHALVGNLQGPECAAASTLPEAAKMLLLDLVRDMPETTPEPNPVGARARVAADRTGHDAGGLGANPAVPRSDRDDSR